MLSTGWRRILIVLLVPLLLFVVFITIYDARRSCNLNMQLRLGELIREKISNDYEMLALFDKNVWSNHKNDGPIDLFNKVDAATVMKYNLQDVLVQVQNEAKTSSLCDGELQDSLIDSAKGIGLLALCLMAAYFTLLALVKTFAWVKEGFRQK